MEFHRFIKSKKMYHVKNKLKLLTQNPMQFFLGAPRAHFLLRFLLTNGLNGDPRHVS